MLTAINWMSGKSWLTRSAAGTFESPYFVHDPQTDISSGAPESM